MSKSSFAFAVIAVGFFSLSVLCAQESPNLENGLKPYGSFHGGDLDSVNLTNGNLTLAIPLLSYPQRGKLSLNVLIRYTNKAWIKKTICPPAGCNDFFMYGLAGGVTLGTEMTYKIGKSSTPIPGGMFTSVTVTSPDGASHQMGYLTGSTNTLRAVDGSGIYMIEDAVSGNNKIIDSYGIQHNGSGVSIIDPNGNTMWVNTASSFTDSMNRSVSSTATTDYSRCVSSGHRTVTSATVYHYPGKNGGYTDILACSATVHVHHDGSGQVGDFDKDKPFIQNIVLPDDTQWIFDYEDNSGDLLKMTFPTGGSISYTWQDRNFCQAADADPSRAVTSRTVNANDGSGGHQWTYTWNTTANPVQTVVRDPAGNDTAHTVTGLGGSCSLYVTQTDYYQGAKSSNVVLKTVKTDYMWNTNPFSLYPNPTLVDSVLPIRVTTIWPNGKQSKIETDYDPEFAYKAPGSNNNITYHARMGIPIAKREYEYGQGAPGGLVRQTLTTYVWQSGNPNYQSYLSANMLNLPVTRIVNNGSGYKCAETDFAYDDPSRLSTPSPPVTVQHGAAPNSVRGNLSSTTRKLSTTPCQSGGTWTSITSYTNTYDTGMVKQAVDPLNRITTYTYDSAFYGAYRTATQYPDTTTPNLAHHDVSGNYDFNTGLLTAFTDENNQESSYSYDSMLRLSQAVFPLGETDFYYPDAVTVERKDKIGSSSWKDTYVRFDGLGRQIRRVQANGESSPWDQVDTCYDARGLVSFTSSPFQGVGLAAPRVCSGAGDAFTYDALKRTKQVTHADGSTVITSYTGAATSVSDEGNGIRRVQRISQADALGRLSSVCEVTSVTLAMGISGSTTPAACGQDIAATGFLTSYLYDGLDNLTRVTQGPLALRTFAYDSLSRLKTATNPESGAVSYVYDNNGNLTQRTQPAPNQTGSATVTSNMYYDELNRLYSKTYTDSTPPATINYDESTALGVALTNTVGRRSSEFTGPSGAKISGSVFSYDSMGRVLNNSQCTPQNCSSGTFPLVYTYDLLGNVLTATNGKGVTLSYTYNVAERATTLSSSLADSGHPGTLFSAAHYNAFGLNTSATLGDNLLGHVSIAEGRTMVTSGNGANRGWLGTYSAGTSGSIYNLSIASYAPNGNILTANDSVNGNWSYGYDDFNRLTSGSKTGAAYSYVYDRFGNRWQQNGPLSRIQTFDANNHNLPTDGITFDAAGNVKSYNDGVETYNYIFDADNRLSTVNTTDGVYSYDAEGRRVRRVVSGTISDYLYDLSGHAITVLNSSGTWIRGEVFLGGRHIATYVGGTGGTTQFSFTDHLGTERVRKPASGGTAETCASLPFGDGQSCTTSDTAPLHFNGKERDAETGMDYFGARYYAGTIGRFLIPDWAAKPATVPYASFGNPQSLNLYSYGDNNPVSSGDPDGHMPNAPGMRSALDMGGGGVTGEELYAGNFNGPLIGAGFQSRNQAQNTSNAAAAASRPPDNPNNLQLVPTSDDGKDHQSYREVVYEVQTKDGKQPEGTWYVTEHQTNKSVASQDGVPGVSGGKENNKFTDLIGCLACRNVESKQTFTISTTPGVKAKTTFPIFVHSKAGDFGTLGLHIDSGGVRINGGLNWFTNPTGP